MENQIRTFTNNNETVVLCSGKDLTKNEIINRLNEMKFMNADPSMSKEDLECIYEIALKNDYNKILIINKLRQDTKYYYRMKYINPREYIDDDNNNSSKKYTKYRFDDQLIDNQSQDVQSNNTQNSSSSPSILRKILNFLNNHKMDILEKVFYLFLIFGFEAFLENYSRKHYFIGKLLKPIRRTITPKRLILGFLFYTIVKYILDVFFYYLFGVGVFAILVLILMNKIKDFIINI
jgi:hypothetical protein